MEELHRHPLWRYGSTAAQWPEPRSTSSKPLAPAEAESALLAYVRLASEAEQQQGIRRSGRAAHQLSTADIAAELHALYTLAAVHVANQQDSQQSGNSSSHHGKKQSLADGDILELLKAYASLEDRSQQQSSAGGSSRQRQQDDAAWDSKAQAAAAAMGALYAFARLADPAGHQEQQHDEGTLQDSQQESQQPQLQLGQAPGQLQRASSSSTVQAYKSLASSNSGQGSSSSSMRSSSHAEGSPRHSASGDLQVLLKLAQLGLQAASQ